MGRDSPFSLLQNLNLALTRRRSFYDPNACAIPSKWQDFGSVFFQVLFHWSWPGRRRPIVEFCQKNLVLVWIIKSHWLQIFLIIVEFSNPSNISYELGHFSDYRMFEFSLWSHLTHVADWNLGRKLKSSMELKWFGDSLIYSGKKWCLHKRHHSISLLF